MESANAQIVKKNEKTAARDLEVMVTMNLELKAEAEYTQELTNKNVFLQSEFKSVVANLAKAETRLGKMVKQLEWEASMRREETEILAQKLAERVKAVEMANQQVTDTNNYLEVVMRQNVARVKELTEELDLTKRNLDNTKKNGGKESNLYTKVERVNMSPNFGQSPFNLAALGANGVNREVSLVSRQESVHNSRHREVYIPPHRRLNKPDKG